MINKMILNTQLASGLLERIQENDLPITIETGDKVGKEMINVIAEYDDEELFGKLLDDTINEIFN